MDNARPNTDIIFACIDTLRHCNARGCEYGRRDTSVQCCSNAGSPSSVGASVRRVQTLFMFIPGEDRLLFPASFSKAKTVAS